MMKRYIGRVFSCILMIVFMECVYGRRIEAPTIVLPDTINVRLDEVINLKVPSHEFKNIYERSVKKIQNKNTIEFPQCTPSQPLLTFPVTFNYLIKKQSKAPKVIYDIEDIIYGNNLVDIIYFDKNLYVMATDGQLIIFTLDPSLQSIVREDIVGTGLTRVSYGNFVINNNQLLFVNNEHMFVLSKDKSKLTKINDYNPNQLNILTEYQNSISINDRYLVVAFSQLVIIYERNDTSLKIIQKLGNTIHKLGKDQFKPSLDLLISDIQYDTIHNIIFVSDELNGIFALRVNITDNKGVTSISINLVSKIQVRGCDLMYVHIDNLYMSCNGLVKVKLDEWPKITIENIIDSKIKIKQISGGDNILFAVGTSLFEVFYNDKLVEYVEDHKLDKILIIGDRFISANEKMIIFGRYQVKPATLQCQIKQQDMIGTHRLIVTTQAECDQKFINSVNPSWRLQYTDQDTCLYPVYITLEVWKPGKLSIVLISFAVAALVVTVWVFILWWCVSRFKLDVINRQLLTYQNLGGNSQRNDNENKGHVQLVQEGGQNQPKSNQQAKEDKQLHAIE